MQVDGEFGVECFPDYIVYRDKHLTDSVIIFSSSWIKIKSSTHYVEDESFEFQWRVDDVIDVESQCCERVSFNWPCLCSLHLKCLFCVVSKSVHLFHVWCSVWDGNGKDSCNFRRFSFGWRSTWHFRFDIGSTAYAFHASFAFFLCCMYLYNLGYLAFFLVWYYASGHATNSVCM